jgi:hypothetical protein
LSELDGSGSVVLPQAVPIRDSTDRDFGLEALPVSLSGETYLRLCELDLADPDAILAFVGEYGILGGALAYDAIVSGTSPSIAEWCSGALSPKTERKRKAEAITRDKARVYPVVHYQPDGGVTFAMSMSEVSGEKDWPNDSKWSTLHVRALLERSPPLVETVNEFRFAAHCIRDLDAAWLALNGGEDNITLSSPADPPDGWTQELLCDFLIQMMTTLLLPLSPQLGSSFTLHVGHELNNGQPVRAGVEPLREPPDLPLYTLCALELFNHMLQGAEYRICANERCNRRFVLQQGRSEKGQHRSRGVKYCSPACARATAQRTYRQRRKRAEAG